MDPRALSESLRRLASNHRWTYTPTCQALLSSLPGAEPARHPVQTVAALDESQLDRLLSDDLFVERVHRETLDLEAVVSDASDPQIAYCSPEFGITSEIPQYAGGLGILAGDHLKSASDLHTPIAGVGLFYRFGVFRQRIDEQRQTEAYEEVPADKYGAIDTGIMVEVPFPDRIVHARVWRMDVGRVPLLLLDTNIGPNSEHDRNITDRLYIGFTDHRLEQEMVLGVGGAKALAAMGWPISVHHLNEGHAGFLALELIDRALDGGDLSDAIEGIRSGLLFTTHTPVPAGIDRFDDDLITPYLRVWAERWGVDVEELFELGRDNDDFSKFNMAAFCLRVSGAANGVSRLHGEVSRELFVGVGIGDQIGHVTNGVHARTWTAPHIQDLFDAALGDSWSNGDPEAWEAVGEISLEDLQAVRRASSQTLAGLIAEKARQHLDPDALIVGFARRFAPYKRANLVMRHRERLQGLLANEERPIHFVFAGKAHPSDEPGKALVSEVVSLSQSSEANGRFTFIPDYNMRVAHAMVQGCDVWLNNPIRPREASGTSGEKVVLNGGLNCSILDGWWDEMYDGRNGWKIAVSKSDDPVSRDDEEAGHVLDAIEDILDEYHSARLVFNGRVRHAWQTLGPKVTAARMLRDYQRLYYGPALERRS